MNEEKDSEKSVGKIVEAVGLSVGWVVIVAASLYVLSLIIDCVELEKNKSVVEQTETTDQWRNINGN